MTLIRTDEQSRASSLVFESIQSHFRKRMEEEPRQTSLRALGFNSELGIFHNTVTAYDLLVKAQASYERIVEDMLRAEEERRQRMEWLHEVLAGTTDTKPPEPRQLPTHFTRRLLRRLIRLLVNRILRMLLHRICNGVAKLGASERHGASPSFMCQYLYPTPRAELI